MQPHPNAPRGLGHRCETPIRSGGRASATGQFVLALDRRRERSDTGSAPEQPRHGDQGADRHPHCDTHRQSRPLADGTDEDIERAGADVVPNGDGNRDRHGEHTEDGLESTFYDDSFIPYDWNSLGADDDEIVPSDPWDYLPMEQLNPTRDPTAVGTPQEFDKLRDALLAYHAADDRWIDPYRFEANFDLMTSLEQ